MRMRWTHTAASILLLGIAAVPAAAQSPEPLAAGGAGVGARALALGEAYQAIGGDFYSLYYNPAALGLARGIRVDGSLTHRSSTVQTRYFGGPSSADLSSTGLDALGVVYPIPTRQGSLVFALGAYRVRDLDSRYKVEGYNTSDDPDLGESWIWARDVDRGALYGYSAGVSVELARGFFLGGSLQATSGTNDYQYLLMATDTEDVWTPYEGHDWDDGIEYSYRGTGLRMTVGGLWQPVRAFSVGASIRLPHQVEITEHWYQSEVLYYDDGTSELTQDESGVFSYRLRIPSEFELGAALTLGGVTLTGGGRYVDYGEAEYSKPPYDGFPVDYFVENYEPLWTWGGGAEMALPGGLRVRGGYQWAPLLFRPAGVDVPRDREHYTLGVGLPIDPAIALDLTYVQTRWETLSGTTSERWKDGRFVVSFGYRF